jgi:hypothetical protein
MERYFSRIDSEMRLDLAFSAPANQTLGVERLLQRGVNLILDSRWKRQRGDPFDPFDHLAGCPGLPLHGQRNSATRTGTLKYAYLLALSSLTRFVLNAFAGLSHLLPFNCVARSVSGTHKLGLNIMERTIASTHVYF